MILQESIKGKRIKQAIDEVDDKAIRKHLRDLFEHAKKLENQTNAIGKHCQECGEEIEDNGVALFSYFHDECNELKPEQVRKIRSMQEEDEF